MKIGDEKKNQHLSESSKNGERNDNIEDGKSEKKNKDDIHETTFTAESREGRKIVELGHLDDQLQ